MTQTVKVDKGGTISVSLVHNAPTRWSSSPTAVVAIYDSSGAALVSSQSVTEGASTTVDAAAAAGQTTIPVAATTGFTRGDQCVLGPNATGQWEFVTIEQINSGTSVVSRDNLLYSYATAAYFNLNEMSVTLTAGEADESRRNCYAAWSYTLGGQAMVEHSVFHMVNWDPRIPLTSQDILKLHPRAAKLISSRQQLDDVIAVLWDELQDQLAQSVGEGQVVSGTALKTALRYRVMAQLADEAEDWEERDRRMAMFDSHFSRMLETAAIDANDDEQIDDDDIVRPAWVGQVYRS